MHKPRIWLAWGLAWTLTAVGGATWLALDRLAQLREVFDTDARIAHRLLSQSMVQHDAMLATLVLLQPQIPSGHHGLSSLYPQVLEVVRLAPGASPPAGWPADLSAAEQRSRASGQAQLAQADLAAGQLYLVQAGQPASYALHLDLRATLPQPEWPLPPATSPVRVWLSYQGQELLLQPGAAQATDPGWAWSSSKTLASPSQPLELRLRQKLDLSLLPWLAMLGWALLCGLALAGLRGLQRQWVARQRAEQLLRLGQVARLNTLGELAAGMAHELNQPLTAILSNSQAARRLLHDDPPELEAAQQAMTQAAEQAKRASAVVGRLRRLVERPELSAPNDALALAPAVADALHLLEPELRRLQVQVQTRYAPQLPAASGDAVALQQILHNLLVNALQAMESRPADERRLNLDARLQGGQLALQVQDSGPGIPAEMRERLFTPFATSRANGLGLGLTLSESLAEAMGGSLRLLSPGGADGACFELRLPPAETTPN